jgi:Fic family protein
VPTAKLYGHLATLEASIAREWPLTQEAAAAELTEAVAHLNDLVPNNNMLFTADLSNALEGWTSDLRDLSTVLTATSRETPEEPLTTEQRDTIRGRMLGTWDLLARIDREITGITAADPGLQP